MRSIAVGAWLVVLFAAHFVTCERYADRPLVGLLSLGLAAVGILVGPSHPRFWDR